MKVNHINSDVKLKYALANTAAVYHGDTAS